MTAGVRTVIGNWLKRTDDGQFMRYAFVALTTVSVYFVATDFLRLKAEKRITDIAPVTSTEEMMPVLAPALTEGAPQPMPGEFRGDPEMLKKPVSFELQPGGILAVSGSIDMGSSERFAAELEKRGEYVKTVALNSPGGSVHDALAMAGEIRKRKLATKVAAGALCASSCPLILAGGVKRTVENGALVGVHQIFNGSRERISPEEAMSNAQKTTAEISRHLAAMGIDSGLWLHALETPPDRLYYLRPDEMRELKLVTSGGDG